MAQEFAARRFSEGDYMDYTPSAAVVAGQVIVLDTDKVAIATIPIAADALGALAIKGIFNIVITTGSPSQGEPMYWDADGDPYNGTAGTGAASNVAGTGPFIGWALEDATGSTDEFVSIELENDPTPSAFETMPTFPAATVVALGTNQATAAAVTTGITSVTGADATVGVVLPEAVSGSMVIIKNVANAVLPVYPATDDVINALAANASLDMAALTSVILVGDVDGLTWYSVPLLPS